MKNKLFRKELVIWIIVLFIGVNIQPVLSLETKISNINIDNEEDCIECHLSDSYTPVKVNLLFSRLEVILNFVSLKFSNIPEVEEKYQDIWDIINYNWNNTIFCNILKSIANKIDELAKKYPEGTIIYSILYLMMLLIIILWSKYCT